MVRVSATAVAMGAVSSFFNVTAGGAMSGLGNVVVLAVGGGVVAVVGAFLPRLMRLVADYARFSPPQPSAQRKKGARADNKWARWRKNEAHRLASKNNDPAPR